MRDRTFAPAVLLGLAAAALTAVASGQEWARTTGNAAGVEVSATVSGADTAPLALALALVALASWGVLLVVRGGVRRAVAVIGVLAAAGVLVTLVDAFGGAQDDSLTAVMAQGATGDAFVSTLTAWYWTTGVAALLTMAALVVAAVRSPGWPAMGSRYDAPGARREPETDEDLWRALDRGDDPTA
ncbi:MAG TPA: Trp biosynthesis-associated membrane protein [Nocardioidaceae bacterium]|nr:Trp biosynthesis-associated membrane protein [Nocardioidaceae bacterium]